MSNSQLHEIVTLEDIEYSINEEEKTASLTRCQSNATEIIIPRSIKQYSKEYIVTIIKSKAFQISNVKSVLFEPNSELRTIEKGAFTSSKLERIRIPASAVDLQDGWCSITKNLIHVEVEQGNARYSSIGGKCVIGKSDINQKDYDTLVFWARDSVEANIPKTIKIIGSGAFSYSKLTRIQIPSQVTQICKSAFLRCDKLSRVEFEPNSQLATIEGCAFLFTSLQGIKIPASTVELQDKWCYGIRNLIHVEVEQGNARYSSIDDKCIIGKSDINQKDYDTLVFWTRDSVEANIPKTIKIINSYAFAESNITSIKIPSHVTKICEGAFIRCDKLSRVEFEPNSELQTIEKYAFDKTKVVSIQIPSHVAQICELTFYNCDQLSQVTFEPNSELRTIKENAFSKSKIVSIKIPSHVTQICEEAFSDCDKLSRVEFEPNSQLKTIEKRSFAFSSLQDIKIPASTVELQDEWCFGTRNLIHVEVEQGNARYSSIDDKCIIGKSDINQKDYDTLVFWARDSVEANIPKTIKIISSYAFAESNITSIKIPSHITHICEHAFSDCQQLSRVEFEPNSELQTIEKEVFYKTNVESIKIPSHVTKICEHAFSHCVQLSRVEFESNSELRTIEKEAFYETNVTSILIPSHVTKICEGAFSYCRRLSRIEFESNSELKTIEKQAFIFTKIPSIKIPASTIDLKDECFLSTFYLEHVEVEPGNARYSSNGNCIIGKSDITHECYDTLVFFPYETIKANIPSTIKIINSYIFYFSLLESILIPSNVTKICEHAFSNCRQLTRVIFEPNSQLKTIEKYAFENTRITSIMIPSHVTQIGKNAFSCCSQLKIVEIEGNSTDDTFNTNTFDDCKIVMLPARVKNHINQTLPK